MNKDSDYSNPQIIMTKEDHIRKSHSILTLKRDIKDLKRIRESFRDLIPPLPPEDAICHKGITSQNHCANCNRISQGYKMIKKLDDLIKEKELTHTYTTQ